jgi:hypothetical protein
MNVVIKGRTIRPETREGDEYFGLRGGTNGTAATTRRALVEKPGLLWLQFDGKIARGLFLHTPSGDAWRNPWDGRAA